MIKTGLTSVTFRKLSCERIIELAAEAGVTGIEWGGDVHVPPNDTANAERVGRLTRESGLEVLSYGSYYKVTPDSKPEEDFTPVLDAAAALGADNVRIWVGNVGTKDADGEYCDAVIVNLKKMSGLAAGRAIKISFEYHRDTLTDNSYSTCRILSAVGEGNVRTYWQYNPDLTFDDNISELKDVLPYLTNAHVFYWTENTRHALSDGQGDWERLAGIITAGNADCAFIIEFVKDDSEGQFIDDAQTLKKVLY